MQKNMTAVITNTTPANITSTAIVMLLALWELLWVEDAWIFDEDEDPVVVPEL